MAKNITSAAIAGFAAMAALCVPMPANADILTFSYAGSFSSQTGLAGDNFAGATISGNYSFDTTTADSEASSTRGVYLDTLTELEGTVVYGGGSFNFAFGAADGNITVWDNDPGAGSTLRDLFETRAGGGDGVFDNLPTYSLVAFNLSMITATTAPGPTAITSTALPSAPPLFDTPTIALTFSPTGMQQNKLEFRVTSVGVVTEQTIPEPATLALLGLGLAGLGLARRRPGQR